MWTVAELTLFAGTVDPKQLESVFQHLHLVTTVEEFRDEVVPVGRIYPFTLQPVLEAVGTGKYADGPAN